MEQESVCADSLRSASQSFDSAYPCNDWQFEWWDSLRTGVAWRTCCGFQDERDRRAASDVPEPRAQWRAGRTGVSRVGRQGRRQNPTTHGVETRDGGPRRRRPAKTGQLHTDGRVQHIQQLSQTRLRLSQLPDSVRSG